jgi:hypothetical protein
MLEFGSSTFLPILTLGPSSAAGPKDAARFRLEGIGGGNAMIGRSSPWLQSGVKALRDRGRGTPDSTLGYMMGLLSIASKGS